jgi:hypothetical protein
VRGGYIPFSHIFSERGGKGRGEVFENFYATFFSVSVRLKKKCGRYKKHLPIFVEVERKSGSLYALVYYLRER